MALLFIAPTELYHEPTWKAWFMQAWGQLPRAAFTDRMCENVPSQPRALSCAMPCNATLISHAKRVCDHSIADDVIRHQHLFSVYVQTSAKYREYIPLSSMEGGLSCFSLLWEILTNGQLLPVLEDSSVLFHYWFFLAHHQTGYYAGSCRHPVPGSLFTVTAHCSQWSLQTSRFSCVAGVHASSVLSCSKCGV